ncbi:hypothetical protein HZS_1735 [Henneguya salminicola]|nr:hypothetical protein HZS_1735 [Henneguya salminicola]
MVENKNESLTESPKIEADSNIDATTTNILIENKPSEVQLDSEFAHIEIEHENIPILTEVIEDSTTFKKDVGNIKKDTKTPETSSSGSRSDLTELVNNIDKYLERKLNHSEGHVENFSVSIDNPNIPLLSDNSQNPDVSTNVLEISTPAIVTNSNPKKSAWYKAKKKIKKENYYKTLDARSRRCITNINKINILSLDQYGTHNSHVELSSTLDTFLQETIKEGKSKKKKKNIKGEQH